MTKRLPRTLALDIGGTGLKAAALDARGRMLTDRARVETTYPMTPSQLVAALVTLTEPLPKCDRVSVGFPGVVRGGCVLTAPHFVTIKGPGTAIDAGLVQQWHRFDLAAALNNELRLPTRVLNDADLQGLDVRTGTGLEVVITLGTGVGSAVFENGRLGPHLELAHHPFRDNESYNDQLGDRARKKIGKKKWNHRLAKAITTWQTLFTFDHCFIGGGNARHITLDLPDNVTLIDQNAGLLGGIKLWDEPTP